MTRKIHQRPPINHHRMGVSTVHAIAVTQRIKIFLKHMQAYQAQQLYVILITQ